MAGAHEVTLETCIDTEGKPRRSAPSQLEMREKYRSTRSHLLEARRQCQSMSASSTIKGLTTLVMTSTNTDAAIMETLKSEAMVLIVADATTAAMTRWLQSRRAIESLVGQSTTRHYLAHSDTQPVSPSIMARPNRNYGWQISDWHASWEVLKETIEPSSNNSHFSSPTPLPDGSRNSRTTKSTTGPIWSEYSRETSRGPTSASATHGTSASASKSLESPSESCHPSTELSSARSSHTSPTMMSSWCSYQALPVKIWCESWDKIIRKLLMR